MYLILNNAKVANILGKRLIHYAKYSKYFEHIPDIILNRDLYKYCTKEDRLKGTLADTFSESIYPRSVVEFKSEFLDYEDLGNTRILDAVKLDNDFKVKIESRIDQIQKFVGPEFELLMNEMLSIICGLSNFDIEIIKKDQDILSQSNFASKTVTIGSSRLRILGKSIYELNIGLSTVFASQRFLSLSSGEIESSLELFNDEKKLIPLFMRRNLLYNSIIPFQGAMRSGPIHSSDKLRTKKSKIHDATSIGSFYTMLGILVTKFDKDEIAKKIIQDKVLDGTHGLINIAMESNNVNRK